jgi:MoxR-like ATPase
MTLQSIDELQESLRGRLYFADRGLATSIFLALKLQRPLFLEGEAGVGKTEVAKVAANLLDTELIRLQCYEGLDVSQAVYEWNYTRQMLHIRLSEARGERTSEQELFGREYLTIQATDPPVVVLTSNRTREVHDALKRRCLYFWIDYPTFEKEFQIIQAKVPDAPVALARQVTGFVQELRQTDLYKIPGVAETLDWTAALVALDQKSLDPGVVDETLGVILKYQDDVAKIKGEGAQNILDRVKMHS